MDAQIKIIAGEILAALGDNEWEHVWIRYELVNDVSDWMITSETAGNGKKSVDEGWESGRRISKAFQEIQKITEKDGKKFVVARLDIWKDGAFDLQLEYDKRWRWDEDPVSMEVRKEAGELPPRRSGLVNAAGRRHRLLLPLRCAGLYP